jgi:hypothetical protein
MADHDLLIDQLSASLAPVQRPRPAGLRALGWMVLALPCGFLATRLIPHYQPDWSAPGMVWPMVEIVLALSIGLTVMVQAFAGSIPGRDTRGCACLRLWRWSGWRSALPTSRSRRRIRSGPARGCIATPS